MKYLYRGILSAFDQQNFREITFDQYNTRGNSMVRLSCFFYVYFCSAKVYAGGFFYVMLDDTIWLLRFMIDIHR